MRRYQVATTLALLLCPALLSASFGQEALSGKKLPTDLTVPSVRGIFIPPIPNAPFSATLEVVSRQELSDGSVSVLKVINRIARDSQGRTYNEGRHFVAESSESEPPLQRFVIYDPVAGLSTRFDPYTLIAWQTVMKTPPTPAAETIPAAGAAVPDPPGKKKDLGSQTAEGLTLHGTRESKGETVNEFWYSPDLSLYIIRKHKDPHWEQTFTVTKIDRGEPEASRFIVPANYKIGEAAQVSDQSGIYKVGNGVSAPRVIHSVDPKYSEQASRARLTGICMVSLIVDTNGLPTKVHVVRPLGMGLDEKAVEAVKQYRFQPAMYEGSAVPVEVNIEINFQIYNRP